jgi:pimeloyl-ACP methyl ester carboxylesterase
MKRVSVGNAALGVVDQGRGKPLLLVHGFPLDHSMWGAQIEAFSRTHRVLAPDLRGFGASDVTAGTVTMADMADDLARLLEALVVAEPVVLCGLSMGGYVGWQFWRRHAAKLERLILCDTRAASDTREVARGRELMAAQVEQEGAGVAADALLGKLFAPQTCRQRPELLEITRQVILSTASAAIAAAQRGMAQRPDMTSVLPMINTPTLLLGGQYDSISPPQEMEAISRAMPSAEFVLIDQAGHMAPVEQPDEVNAAIARFLAN